jgi:hypothetical protein
LLVELHHYRRALFVCGNDANNSLSQAQQTANKIWKCVSNGGGQLATSLQERQGETGGNKSVMQFKRFAPYANAARE